MLIPTFSWNWSGLDDSADGPFSSVTATWTEPPIQPAGATFTDAAFWVGLDGDNSDTVEQIGTEGYSEGAVGYDAWFEMYPAGPVTIDLSIRPGDVVTGTVVEMGVATLTLSLVDHTSGKSFQTTQSPTAPPARASAEVIAEAPTDDMDDVVALGGFGLVQFTDCSFNGRPIGSYDLNQIDMYSDDNGRLADRTLSLSADGAGFAVTTDVTAPTTEVTGAAPVWHDRAQTLRFKATDNPGGQGLAYTEYSFDGGVSWTRGDAATVAAPGDHSADGVRRVVYRSVDVVGNVEARRLCRVLIDTRQPRPVANWRATARRGSDATLRYLIDDPRPGSPTATATIRISDARGELVKKAVLRAVRVDTPVLDVRLPAAQGHVPLHGDGHRRRRQAWRDILLQHAGGALMSTAWGAAERPEVRHRRKALRRGSKMKRAWLVVCIAVVAAASAAVCATPASALVPDGTHGWFWQMPQPAGGLAGFSALAFPDAGNLWAVGAGGLVLHSTDAGGTWAAQSTGTDADLWSVSFSDDRHGWACGGPVAGAGGAIVGTTDGGATWRNETPAGLKETLTDVSFVDAVHGWIGTTDDHVLRTTDGGATWARLKIGVVPPPSDDEDDDYGTSGYVQVDFASALRGWASTGSGLSITTDGGKTWMPLFDTLSRDMVVAQIDFVDPTHGWVLAYSEDDGSARVIATSNGGFSWRTVSTGDAYVGDIDATSASEVWLLDGGSSPFVDFGDLYFGLNGSEQIDVLHSTDGGARWRTSSVGSPFFVGAIAAHGGNVCAVGDGILTSSDTGETWKSATSGQEYAFTAATALSPTDVWAVDASGAVLHSADGSHWVESSSPSRWASALYGVSFPDARDGWAVGASDG